MLSLRHLAKLEMFDSLPDDSIVDDPVAAALLSISVQTLRRENVVPARKISGQRQGRRTGDLRAKIRNSIIGSHQQTAAA
jgi:hypothetical protein